MEDHSEEWVSTTNSSTECSTDVEQEQLVEKRSSINNIHPPNAQCRDSSNEELLKSENSIFHRTGLMMPLSRKIGNCKMHKREGEGKDDPIKKKALSAYNQKQERERVKEAKIKEMAQRKKDAAMAIKKAREAK